MGHLIQLHARTLPARKAAFRVPISASSAGMRLYDGVRDQADLTIVHGNKRAPAEKRTAIAALGRTRWRRARST